MSVAIGDKENKSFGHPRKPKGNLYHYGSLGTELALSSAAPSVGIRCLLRCRRVLGPNAASAV